MKNVQGKIVAPKKSHFTGVAGLTMDRGHYRWRNRITKKRIRLGSDLIKAIEQATKLNILVERQLQQKKFDDMQPITVGDIVDLFLLHQLDKQAWSKDTKHNNASTYRRYKKEFGDRNLKNTNRIFIGQWLADLNTSADTYNGHRHLLILLWNYAISLGECESNEPEKTLKLSMSKKIDANQRSRKRLTLKDFKIIRKAAPDWLQNAMIISLLTLQARKELTLMKYTDIRNGKLYIIRQKTAKKSDLAFIRLPVTASLKREIVATRKSDLICPYVIHTKPVRRNPKQMASKPHPYSVTPDHISKTFRKVTDEIGIFDHLEKNEQPSFHEIRSLGTRIMKQRGYSKKDIRGYTGHADKKTVEIYLENPDDITDEHFNDAVEGLSLAEALQ